MIRSEEKRLRDVFQRLLLLALAAPAATGCSSSSTGSTPPPGAEAGSGNDAAAAADGSGQDATTGGDAGVESEGGGAEAGGDANLDAGLACPPGTPYHSEAGLVTVEAGTSECYYFVDFPCAPNYKTGTGQNACYLYLADCADICTLGSVDCHYWENAGCIDDGGATNLDAGEKITIACGLCSGVGRRPAGLLSAAPEKSRDPLGEYFARVAHLEAASVFAFERLRDELRASGAPAQLVACAERSIGDELRHTRMTTHLARRHGGEPAKVRVRRPRRRALESMARENAVEGCIRETFGAMIATWQAAHASDPGIRAAMAKIAADETRHAALAWSVAKWAETRLSPAARRRIDRARRGAIAGLEREASSGLPAAASREAGLPDARHARALIAAMAEIWS